MIIEKIYTFITSEFLENIMLLLPVKDPLINSIEKWVSEVNGDFFHRICTDLQGRFDDGFILELIPKPLSTAICCKSRGSTLSAKKVLNVHEARLRAFSTSGLDHGIFAQSRHKTGFGMSSN